MPQNQCPVCGSREASVEPTGDGRDTSLFTCDTCGRYIITYELRVQLESDRPGSLPLLWYLSAHTRQAADVGDVVTLTTDNWEEFARAHQHTSMSQKVDMLLRLVESRTDAPGRPATFRIGSDYPLLDARDPTEAQYLLSYVLISGYVDGDTNSHDFTITMKGWDRLAPTGGVPGTCFVAMSARADLDDAFDNGILKAVEDNCHFKALRIDRSQHNDNINDKIMAGIRQAQFMVADFTLQKQNVYFEAGLALGLSRPGVWTCRDNEFHLLHFDTRPFNFVRWSTAAELRERLTDRIRATIAGSA